MRSRSGSTPVFADLLTRRVDSASALSDTHDAFDTWSLSALEGYHGAGKGMKAMNEVSVRVVVFQEGGDRVCAQCLEYDIAAQGKTLDDCLHELDRLIAGHIAISVEHGLEPLRNLKPAPRRFWDWFDNSKNSAAGGSVPIHG